MNCLKYIPLVFILSACSSAPSDEYIKKSEVESLLADYKNFNNDWDKYKESIQRLSSVEAELTLLIAQLAEIKDSSIIDEENITESKKPLSNSNFDAVEVAIASEPEEFKSALLESTQDTLTITRVESNEVEKLKEFNATAIEQIEYSDFAIQLASLSNRYDLEKLASSIEPQIPPLFSGLFFQYQPVVVNGMQFYRLQAAGFKNKNESESLCDILKSKQINCFVVKPDKAQIELL